MKEILKVLVGSRAHGLADADSDYDYRGVFVVDTTEILKLGGKIKNTHWVEGQTDQTSWEIGHFLQMATKCNPTILEVFHAPIKIQDSTPCGLSLRNLFDKVWNTNDVMNSHIGYGLNQRKKFLEDKEGRKSKYACAYLRTLYQGYSLLENDIYPVDMTDTEIFDDLKKYRAGEYEYGEVIDTCFKWQRKLEAAAKNRKKETDLKAVNKFLLELRRLNWGQDNRGLS